MNSQIIRKNKHKRSLINSKEIPKEHLIKFQNTEKEKEKHEEMNKNTKIPFLKRIKLFLTKNKYVIVFIGTFLLIAIILAIVIPIILKKYENDNENILFLLLKLILKKIL